MTFRDTEWMTRAACRLNPNWTATVNYFGINNREIETVPDRRVLARLAVVCASCPVTTECADYALRRKMEGGMYAGVWVPLHRSGARGHTNPGWAQARALLQQRAVS